MIDVSVLITARNEEFLSRTVEDVLAKREANTEVIVILDGAWASPPIKDHKDVTIVYHKESIGQRAGINEASKLARGKYIMKLDAHCIMDQGFDVKLMKDCKPDWTVIPAQLNLHAFNWRCKKCGNEWYQSPTPTRCQLPGEGKGDNKACDSKEFEKVIVWKPRFNRKTDSWVFDSDLHFQYDGGIAKRQTGQLIETMSFIGACWFLEKKRYEEIGGLDESYGSWGQMGTELACKSWLSGGKVMVNKNTWFAHLFRTQGGDFSFPYPQSNKQVENARKKSKEYFRDGKWEGKYPLSWLVERFYPVKGWNEKDLAKIGGDITRVKDYIIDSKEDKMGKGIIYYTDNQLNLKIAHAVQDNLNKMGLPIVSSSLKPMTFGDNVVLKEKRGYMTMFKQILAALEKSKSEIIFFCEHDVMYHPSHFDFTPKEKDVWYYNINLWKLNAETGTTVKTDDCKQVSGICVYRETAIAHYKKRIEMLEERIRTHGDHEFNGYVRKVGFEPGTHNRPEKVDNNKAESYSSKHPNIDIRHGGNLTATRWSPEQFVNKKFTEGWTEGNIKEIDGWSFSDFKFLGF